MGKGIKIPTHNDTISVFEGAGEEELPRVKGEEGHKSKAERYSDLILQGKSPSAAAKIVKPGSKSEYSMDSLLQKSETIVERNRRLFEKVGMKKEAPYRVLVDIMQNATKTIPKTTMVDGKAVTVWKVHPDYTARLAAARQVTSLMGLDPRNEMRVTMASNGKGGSFISVEIGNQYIEIASMTDEQAKLAAYNELKRGQYTGGYKLETPDMAAIAPVEAEFTVSETAAVQEAAPIGAGE